MMASNISEKVGTSRNGRTGLCLSTQVLGTHTSLPREPTQHLQGDAANRKIEMLVLLQGK